MRLYHEVDTEDCHRGHQVSYNLHPSAFRSRHANFTPSDQSTSQKKLGRTTTSGRRSTSSARRGQIPAAACTRMATFPGKSVVYIPGQRAISRGLSRDSAASISTSGTVQPIVSDAWGMARMRRRRTGWAIWPTTLLRGRGEHNSLSIYLTHFSDTVKLQLHAQAPSARKCGVWLAHDHNGISSVSLVS